MSLKVICTICAGLDPPKEVILQSKLIAKSDEEDIMNVCQEMFQHFQTSHNKLMIEKVLNGSGKFTGLLVMSHFKGDDKFEKEKEQMRDQVAELVMFGAPEEDLEDDLLEDEEDELEDEDEEGEEDEDEDEDEDEELDSLLEDDEDEEDDEDTED